MSTTTNPAGLAGDDLLRVRDVQLVAQRAVLEVGGLISGCCFNPKWASLAMSACVAAEAADRAAERGHGLALECDEAIVAVAEFIADEYRGFLEWNNGSVGVSMETAALAAAERLLGEQTS